MEQRSKLLIVTMLSWPIVVAGGLAFMNRVLSVLDARQLIALGPDVLFVLGMLYVLGLGVVSVVDGVTIVRGVLILLGLMVSYVSWTVWDQAGVQQGRVRATLNDHLGEPMDAFVGEYDAWGHSFEKVSGGRIECWRSLGSDRRPGGREPAEEDIYFCSDGHVFSDNPFVKTYLEDHGFGSKFGGSPCVLGAVGTSKLRLGSSRQSLR